MEMKTFKQFLITEKEEVPFYALKFNKVDIPEYFNHYINLKKMIKNSKKVNDRKEIKKAIEYCLSLNDPSIIYSGIAYRGTYVSNEKLGVLYSTGQCNLDLMPYYSFAKEEKVARGFMYSRNIARNGILIKKKIKGILSVAAVGKLESMVIQYLEKNCPQYLKWQKIKSLDDYRKGKLGLANWSMAVIEICKKLFNESSELNYFLDNINPSYVGYFEPEGEVIVSAPINITLKDCLCVGYSSDRESLRVIINKNLKSVINNLLPSSGEESYKKINDMLKKQKYTFSLFNELVRDFLFGLRFTPPKDSQEKEQIFYIDSLNKPKWKKYE